VLDPLQWYKKMRDLHCHEADRLDHKLSWILRKKWMLLLDSLKPIKYYCVCSHVLNTRRRLRSNVDIANTDSVAFSFEPIASDNTDEMYDVNIDPRSFLHLDVPDTLTPQDKWGLFSIAALLNWCNKRE
jgi:hypothetical protein